MKQDSERSQTPIGGSPEPAADTPVAVSEEVVWKTRAEQARSFLSAFFKFFGRDLVRLAQARQTEESAQNQKRDNA